ncbi:MAG: MFS transporter [Pseudolysinimonas sp.]
MTQAQPVDAAARIPIGIAVKLYLLTFATFLVGTNSFVIAGLLPDIGHSLNAGTSDVGLSFTVYAGTVAVLAPTFATVFGRVSRTLLVTVGMILVAAGTALTAISTTLPIFMVGRAIAAVGGAAIVPTAVAAAASMVTPLRRGQAIGIVALGFTLSTAIGSPLGTAIAAVGGWQIPLAAVAVLSLVSAASLAFFVRGIPASPPLSFARRFAVLGDPRTLLTVLAVVATVMGFNIAYIYSSAFTATATGGSRSLFAALLLLYGIGGVLGNLIAGRLTDRFGNRIVASILLATQLAVLALMPPAEPNFIVMAVLFLIWGASAFGAGIPIQHRLVAIDPERSAVSLSWYSTALYVGIAIAPIVGGFALDAAGPNEVPHAAAAAILLAVVLLQVGYLVGRRRGTDATLLED